ncbi:MAG TPA: GNAT family N-acetyltransferase [Caulobacteraceae bacterium]|jgi:GNAT superfamily N-acetyltransferase
MLSIRPARLPDDASAIEAIDTSFVTSQIYEADVWPEGIGLGLKDLDEPIRKRFPLDDLRSGARPYTDAWVALTDDRVIGFAATSFEAWNSRLVLRHFYVDPSARRQGVGRKLIEVVKAHGKERGARHLWLETSSLNTPGVGVYAALGFSLTGADLTLYEGTPAEGEVALFYSHRLT